MIETGHPEARCDRCRRENMSWVTDSDRFNASARALGLKRGAVLCPVCFALGHELATELTTSWQLDPGTPFRPTERP